jgi:hypothetical protein
MNVTPLPRVPLPCARPPWLIPSTVSYPHPSVLTPLSTYPPPDFCLWAPAKPNSIIADTEGEEVAWCTKPGRGTRIIPPNALTGVQFMRTPDYLQVVGYIDQTLINLEKGDSGGELDPHGADLVSYLVFDMFRRSWADLDDSAAILWVVSCFPMDFPVTVVIIIRTSR